MNMEILHHTKWVLTDNQQWTDGQEQTAFGQQLKSILENALPPSWILGWWMPNNGLAYTLHLNNSDIDSKCCL